MSPGADKLDREVFRRGNSRVLLTMESMRDCQVEDDEDDQANLETRLIKREFSTKIMS